MSNVTEILSRMELGDPAAAEELLPLVYAALRKMAAQRMANEKPGQTLSATALVHEAYLRLVDADTSDDTRGEAAAKGGRGKSWGGRGHFFAAAAEAMRRILVEQARRKRSEKGGGKLVRAALPAELLKAPEPSEELIDLSEALDRLALADPAAAELVKLRFFAGLTAREAAEVLGIPPRSADRLWAYARAFLYREMYGESD